MAGRSDVRLVSDELASLDRRGFDRPTGGFGDTPGLAPVVVTADGSVDVTLPRCMRGMPDDARRETLERALDRAAGSGRAPYGPRAAAYMGTAAFRAERRRWLAADPAFARSARDASRLEDALGRLADMLDPAERMAVVGLRASWRAPVPSMRGAGCAACDPASRTVVVDGRLAARAAPGVLADFVLWREVCAVAAWVPATCRVDAAARAAIYERFPREERVALERACAMMGWPGSGVSA